MEYPQSRSTKISKATTDQQLSLSPTPRDGNRNLFLGLGFLLHRFLCHAIVHEFLNYCGTSWLSGLQLSGGALKTQRCGGTEEQTRNAVPHTSSGVPTRAGIIKKQDKGGKTIIYAKLRTCSWQNRDSAGCAFRCCFTSNDHIFAMVGSQNPNGL